MKIRIKFRKQGAMKFIGHLDIMRYFQKVMRRAEVNIRYSEGFSPHQIMSFATPLGVGLLSNGEYLDIEVLSTEDSKTMVRRMNAVMSEGMEVLSWRKLDDSSKSAMSLVAAADYILTFRPGREPENMDGFFAALEDFYNRETIPIRKKTKHGEKAMDLKPLIYRLERVLAVPSVSGTGTADDVMRRGAADKPARAVMRCGAADKPTDAVFMRVSTGSTDNIKPELVMETFYDSMGWELAPFTFQTEREEVYARADDLAEQSEGIPDTASASETAHAGGCFIPLEELGEEIE